MGNDANGIVACVKLKFFHLEGGGLNHQRDYQAGPVVSFPSVVFSIVIDRFNDERLRCKEQALCAAYLSLKNRELQLCQKTDATSL
jgi:hypothetical protein